MALLKEFEKNVEVVVEILEHWSEVIEQQFIYEDLSKSQTKEGVTVITSLGNGLKEKALNDVSVAMFFGSHLWKNSFNEILMWLNRYMPQFKSQIERQYSNIVNHLNEILSARRDFPDVKLCGLRDEIRKLANDLRYCAKMASEEWQDEKDEQSSDDKVRNTKQATETENIEQQEKGGQSNGVKVDSPNEKSYYSLFWKHHWKWIIGTSIALIGASIALIALIWSIMNT